jgi:DNA invertase Pin-like site-specific DNA recombinase
VSTDDQDAALQTDALTAAGCLKVFTDTASGSLAHRPQLDRMLDQLRTGDVVVVWNTDFRPDDFGVSRPSVLWLVRSFGTTRGG